MTTELLAFLGGGSLASVLLVQLFKFAYGKIEGRYGPLVTQCIVLGFCFFVVLASWGLDFLPTNFVVAVGSIFAGAIALYEVVIKALWSKAIKGK